MLKIKENILLQLKELKNILKNDGFIIDGIFGSYARGEETQNSDVDILVEATPKFANMYGFGAIRWIKEIELELSKGLGLLVDLADSTGMGKTEKKLNKPREI